MGKAYLKDKIIASLEGFENEIQIFKGGVAGKLGILQDVMDGNDEFENEKDEEVTMLSKKFETI